MTRECDEQIKSSWSKQVVTKWLNLRSSADEFHSDYSIKDTPGRRDKRMSYSSENSCAIVPEEFSEEWLAESNHEVIENSQFSSKTHPVTDPLNLRMVVGTWNVGGKSPDQDLTFNHWLTTHAPADIYVLGFQEIVPLNAGNVLGAGDSGPATKWLSLIRRALNNQTCDHQLPDCYDYTADVELKRTPLPSPTSRLSFSDLISMEDELSHEDFSKFMSSNPIPSSINEESHSPSNFPMRQESPTQDAYTRAASKQMVGLFLCVWVRSDLYRHISNLKVSCVGRGIMGYLGNKGSISVSMTLHNTTFCFVCTHLASGQKEGDEVKRNMDVVEILKKTKFPSSRQGPGRPIHPNSILDHDKIVWLGDLNYRLATGNDTNELLQKNDWQALLEKDQFKIEQQAGHIFKGWEEGRICFPPTYKYLTNSDNYVSQTSSSKEKRRTPAWCDRILWKGEGLKQIWYERGESKFSDHRPVYSLFAVETNAPNKLKVDNKSKTACEVLLSPFVPNSKPEQKYCCEHMHA